MKKIAFVVPLLVTFQLLQAQVTVRVDNTILNTGGFGFQVMGVMPAGAAEMVDLVKGSPFYNDTWIKSKVVTEKGAIFQDVPIKVNLYDQTIHYQDASGKEMVTTTPLSEILFDKDAGKNRVHFINGNLLPGGKKGWYQLLVNDQLTLVKGFKKFLETHTSYNTAKQFSINTSELYSVFYKGTEYEMKRPGDMIDILPNKKAEIESHIKKNNKGSKEEQLRSVVTFANTLL